MEGPSEFTCSIFTTKEIPSQPSQEAGAGAHSHLGLSGCREAPLWGSSARPCPLRPHKVVEFPLHRPPGHISPY